MSKEQDGTFLILNQPTTQPKEKKELFGRQTQERKAKYQEEGEDDEEGEEEEHNQGKTKTSNRHWQEWNSDSVPLWWTNRGHIWFLYCPPKASIP